MYTSINSWFNNYQGISHSTTEKMSGMVIVDERFCFEEETHLTVHKTSVFFPGDGFIVYDPKGELILRFDSYGPDSQPKDELVLMEASGKCLLTLLRKVTQVTDAFTF